MNACMVHSSNGSGSSNSDSYCVTCTYSNHSGPTVSCIKIHFPLHKISKSFNVTMMTPMHIDDDDDDDSDQKNTQLNTLEPKLTSETPEPEPEHHIIIMNIHIKFYIVILGRCHSTFCSMHCKIYKYMYSKFTFYGKFTRA